MGSIKEGDKYRVRHNKEFFQKVERIKIPMRERERKVTFYDDLVRMNNKRLTSRVSSTAPRGKADEIG